MTGKAEPPVKEVSPKSHPPGRPRVPSYRVMLDVPADLIWFVSRLRRPPPFDRDQEKHP